MCKCLCFLCSKCSVFVMFVINSCTFSHYNESKKFLLKYATLTMNLLAKYIHETAGHLKDFDNNFRILIKY